MIDWWGLWETIASYDWTSLAPLAITALLGLSGFLLRDWWVRRAERVARRGEALKQLMEEAYAWARSKPEERGTEPTRLGVATFSLESKHGPVAHWAGLILRSLADPTSRLMTTHSGNWDQAIETVARHLHMWHRGELRTSDFSLASAAMEHEDLLYIFWWPRRYSLRERVGFMLLMIDREGNQLDTALWALRRWELEVVWRVQQIFRLHYRADPLMLRRFLPQWHGHLESHLVDALRTRFFDFGSPLKARYLQWLGDPTEYHQAMARIYNSLSR